MKDFDLSGKWDFILDSEKQGILKEFYKTGEWKDSILLPGTISAQKKSPEKSERSAGFLTDPYAYEGFGWFKKSVTIENFSEDKTYTLVLERTRVSHLWINGIFIGQNNTICGKQLYDITETVKTALTNGTASLEIVLMLDNVSYPTKGGHMTSPDTQTNWLGVTGEIKITEKSRSCLENLRIYTSALPGKTLRLTATLAGTKENLEGRLALHQVIFDSKKDTSYTTVKTPLFEKEITFAKGSNDFTFDLPEETLLWSAENPELYQMTLTAGEEIYTELAGIKTFAVNNTHFEINGRREFLRGKHDGMIFPETGYAPCSLEGWLKVMKVSKEYGINHYRFHTSCPPQAAFTAADLLGIYMEPELPFWGTIQNVGEEGFNEEEQEYLISEGFKILDNFGNHTSFTMLSLGNELWGSGDRLNFILKGYHDYDSRHLYTSGSNNFQFWPQTMEYEDFFVGCRFDKQSLIRGSYAMCDAPQGFIQTESPNTNHDYDLCFSTPVAPVSEADKAEDREIEIQYGTGVKKVKASSVSTQAHFLPHKPVISHEVGQYCMYPNFEENKRFTGVLKPYNFEIFQERLKTAGMENQAQDFFRDSSRLAVQCYKQEIEAIRRSNELSGFQLLDIQDFTGQGTAVVGVLNAFMESKGIVSGEQWRTFCDETVLLAGFESFVLSDGQELKADIILSNYSDNSYKGDVIWAYLIDSETDEILAEESYENNNPVTGNKLLGTFCYKLENLNQYKKYTLMLYLNSENGKKEIMNSYILHVYPKADAEISKLLKTAATEGKALYKNVLITTDAGTAQKNASRKVLYFPASVDAAFPGVEKQMQTVPGTYCTDFWCYPMFRSISESMKKPVPVGTLGLTIKNEDKSLKGFPTDTYTTPKWYNIVSHAQCVNLAATEINPVIQMIDNFERNWKLGLLYKTDNILVCTSRLNEIADKCEVTYFVKSLLEYLADDKN